MKSIITKVMMLAGILLACAPLSHATLGNSVSSATVALGPSVPIPAFLVRKGESVFYNCITTAAFTVGTTIQLEASTNMTNWSIQASTAAGAGTIGAGINGSLAPVYVDTFYRWNVVTSSGSGPITFYLADNDDNLPNSPTVKNNKSLDVVTYNDDSLVIAGVIQPDRYRYRLAQSSANVIISSFSQIQWGVQPIRTKVYGWCLNFATVCPVMDTNWMVIQATGTAADAGVGENSITLNARPTISTETATNGDVIYFQSQTSSVTFSDNNTLAGSALKLGAATRALGVNDILGLIFYNGFWREILFANNQ